MLQHYVFIKYRPGTDEAHIDEFRRRMLALPGQVPGIAQLMVGRDILQEARSWDLVLDMRFASLEDLRRYQQHPAHQAVMQFNQPWVAEVAAVDCCGT